MVQNLFSDSFAEDPSALIVKHNDLIEAQMTLSLLQMRIFLKTLSLIHKDDTDFTYYPISIQELLQEAGVKTNNWAIFKEEIRSMTSITIELPRTGKGFLITSLFSSAEYIEKKGILEVTFDPKLKPYLLQLKGNFTSYQLRYALQMKSVYSIRVYELLKQYVNLGKRNFTVEQFRAILKLDTKYKNFNAIKTRILDKSQADCLMYSDIEFDYNLSRNRIGKVTGIHFTIRHQKTANEQEYIVPIEYQSLQKELEVQGISLSKIASLFEEYPATYLHFVWHRTKQQQPKKPSAYFLMALKEGYFKKDFTIQAQKNLPTAIKAKQLTESQTQRLLEEAFFTHQHLAKKSLPTPTIDDRKEFEQLMQDRMKTTPAFKITYQSYLEKGTNSDFEDFMLRKYGESYEYDIEAFKVWKAEQNASK